LDTAGIVKSHEQLQAEQQQAAQQSIQNMVAQQMIGSVGNIAESAGAAAAESAAITPQ